MYRRRHAACHRRTPYKMQLPTFCVHPHLKKTHPKFFKSSVENLRKWYPKPSKSTPGGSQRRSQEQVSKKTPKSQKNSPPFESLFRPWDRLWRHLFFNVFWGPSRRGLFRIWEPRRPPKWRPLGVMFETLAENLEYVIFEDHSMVLAGPGTHN